MQKFGSLSFSSGASFMELMRRPLITTDDMHAIERMSTTVGMVDIWLGGGGPGSRRIERMFYRGERTRPMPIMGTTERYVDINFAKMEAGRSFTEQEVQRARRVAVSATASTRRCSRSAASIRSASRCASAASSTR